ncbi:MAG: diguanylate cyclase [Deltaproteobacteria bacterium]|nr:diguanylate cyclase [Deltaproteobacteria bacterium]
MEQEPLQSISEYIDLTLWNEFQESLHASLDISIALFHTDGTLFAPPGRVDTVSELIEKRTTRGLELYRESYRRAIMKAVQSGEPYVYRCFTNQYIFVIPVTLDKNRTITIIGGHVYLSEENFREFMERSADLGMDDHSINELKMSVKIVHPQEFFTKPHVVKTLTVPFLRSLYLKGYFEKGYYQMQSVIESTVPTRLPESDDDIYRQVFNTLGVLFDVDTASLMIRSGKEGFTTRATFGRKRRLIENWTTDDSMGMIKNVIALRKAVSCKNPSVLKEMGLSEELSSLYLFPMLSWDNVPGLLCVFNTELPSESAKLISLLANQLSIVIEGLKGEHGEHDVNKCFNGIELLQDIYKSIAPVLDRKDLYSSILNKSAELVGAEQGSLMMLSGKDKTLAIKATKGIDKRILDKVKIKVGEGISGKVIEKGTPIIVKDIESELISRKSRSRYKTGSFVSLPLKIESRTVGVINISDKITGEVFSKRDLDLLQSFACYASIALERGNYHRMTEELKKISVTDALTGLLNRRYFQERLFEEVERSKRQCKSFTLFIIDIDDFKAFNDRYGHLAGDEALKRVANAIKDAVRSIDVVSRLGGEEFCAILPYTTKSDAYVIAERIRQDVAEVRFMGENIPSNQWLTISLGVAEFPTDANTIDELIDKADKAMYLAKARGKNRIIEYGQ